MTLYQNPRGPYTFPRQAAPKRSSAYQRMILTTTGLIHYWPLDEAVSGTDSYKDRVGVSHWTPRNNSLSIPRRPSLLKYDANGSLGIASSGLTATIASLPTAFSLEGWYASTTGNTSGLGSWDGNGQMLYAVGSVPSFYVGATGLFASSSSTGAPWHIVGTYNGTTATIYVNGVQENQAARTRSNSGTYWEIGNYTSGTGAFMNGRAGHVAIYSRALSAAEVLAHYRAGA